MPDDTIEEYTSKVITLVKAEIGEAKWYRGVCLDTVRESFESQTSVADAVVTARMDTEMWDNPDFLAMGR